MKLSKKERAMLSEFRRALARKMLAKKEDGKGGWDNPDWMDECRQALAAHIVKGDPLDVGLFAAFLWHYGARSNA